MCALRHFMWPPSIYFEPSKIELNAETTLPKRTKVLRGLNNTETRHLKRLGAVLQRYAKHHTLMGHVRIPLHARSKPVGRRQL